MKKTLLSLLVALAGLSAMAQTTTNYDEKLIVSINGEASDSVPAAITVTDNGDGTIDFSLKNFMLDDIAVGNIDLKSVAKTSKGGYSEIQTKQTITIAPGDDPEVDPDAWLGPMLGEVPIDLSGKLDDTHMYVTINIDMMSSLEQMILVTVGQDVGFNTTGIKAVSAAKQQGTKTFTLDGRRAGKSAKGLLIVDGKKVVR